LETLALGRITFLWCRGTKDPTKIEQLRRTPKWTIENG